MKRFLEDWDSVGEPGNSGAGSDPDRLQSTKPLNPAKKKSKKATPPNITMTPNTKEMLNQTNEEFKLKKKKRDVAADSDIKHKHFGEGAIGNFLSSFGAAKRERQASDNELEDMHSSIINHGYVQRNSSSNGALNYHHPVTKHVLSVTPHDVSQSGRNEYYSGKGGRALARGSSARDLGVHLDYEHTPRPKLSPLPKPASQRQPRASSSGRSQGRVAGGAWFPAKPSSGANITPKPTPEPGVHNELGFRMVSHEVATKYGYKPTNQVGDAQFYNKGNHYLKVTGNEVTHRTPGIGSWKATDVNTLHNALKAIHKRATPVRKPKVSVEDFSEAKRIKKKSLVLPNYLGATVDAAEEIEMDMTKTIQETFLAVLDEGRGRPRKNPDASGSHEPAHEPDQNIVMQMKKAVSHDLERSHEVKFANGETHPIEREHAHAWLTKHASQKPEGKLAMQQHAEKSLGHFRSHLHLQGAPVSGNTKSIVDHMHDAIRVKGFEQHKVPFAGGEHPVEYRHAKKFLGMHGRQPDAVKKHMETMATKSHAHFMKTIGV